MSNTEYTIDVTIEESNTPIDVAVYSDEPMSVNARDSVGSTETDHRLLTHRDAPDQHPMAAITGLNTSLQNMSMAIDTRLTANENGIIMLQGDVADAATTATGYLTPVDSGRGIRLHTEDSAMLDYMQLDGDGMEVYKSTEKVASFGDTTTIGAESSAHLDMDAGGIRGYSSDNSLYFSVRQGDLGTIYSYMPFYQKQMENPQAGGWREYDFVSSSGIRATSQAVRESYAALENGSKFRVSADYYVRYYIWSGDVEQVVLYSSQEAEFIKGTDNTSNPYIKYVGGIVKVAASDTVAPTLPSYDTSSRSQEYAGQSAYYGASTTGYFPFYKFGTDVADSGGASSFVMNTGTKADYNNQLALGTYNNSPSDATLLVGNGASDSTRSNSLTLHTNGNLTIAGSLTQSSDRRLKEHIGYLGEDAVRFINGLKPAHFVKDAEHHTGFYAQDVESVDAWHCMTGEMNGFKTLGYTELIAPLVAYCQSLEKRIEELERN